MSQIITIQNGNLVFELSEAEGNADINVQDGNINIGRNSLFTGALNLGNDASNNSVDIKGTTIELGNDGGAVNIGAQAGTGAVALYNDAESVLVTTTQALGGVFINNTLTGGGSERVLTTSDVFTANTPLNLIGDINTATPPTTEAITSKLQFRDLADDDNIGFVGYEAEDILVISNTMEHANVSLEMKVRNGSGGDVTVFTALGQSLGQLNFQNSSVSLRGGSTNTGIIVDANTVELRYQNNRRLYPQPDGIQIHGDLNNDPTAGGVQDTRINFLNDLTAVVGDLGWITSSADFDMINRVRGGSIRLISEDTGGAERTFLTGDPDAITTLTGDTELRFVAAAVEASRVQAATVQTTTVSITEIIGIAVASGEGFGFEIHCMGTEDATGDTVFERVFGAIRNQGGTTALVGNTITDRTDDAGATTWAVTVAADDSTDELTVDVTGEGSHTIDWKIRVHLLNV